MKHHCHRSGMSLDSCVTKDVGYMRHLWPSALFINNLVISISMISSIDSRKPHLSSPHPWKWITFLTDLLSPFGIWLWNFIYFFQNILYYIKRTPTLSMNVYTIIYKSIYYPFKCHNINTPFTVTMLVQTWETEKSQCEQFSQIHKIFCFSVIHRQIGGSESLKERKKVSICPWLPPEAHPAQAHFLVWSFLQNRCSSLLFPGCLINLSSSL